MDDVIVLVSYARTVDDYGVEQKTVTRKQVLAKVASATKREFYEGGRNGLNPEYKFTVFFGDYSGETVCQYHGMQYSIYRAYRIPDRDYIELHVERKGGTNAFESGDDDGIGHY